MGFKKGKTLDNPGFYRGAASEGIWRVNRPAGYIATPAEALGVLILLFAEPSVNMQRFSGGPHVVLFVAENSLALLPKLTGKQQAIDYYLKSVTGTIKNIHGDKIHIEPREQNHMFSDKNAKKGQLKPPRVRRLPWIRQTLGNTNIIKLSLKNKDTRELYLAVVGVPRPFLTKTIPSPEYFCVVVNREWDPTSKRTKRKFVTAYPISGKQYSDATTGQYDAYDEQEPLVRG